MCLTFAPSSVVHLHHLQVEKKCVYEKVKKKNANTELNSSNLADYILILQPSAITLFPCVQFQVCVQREGC